jgi:hypothetical protein
MPPWAAERGIANSPEGAAAKRLWNESRGTRLDTGRARRRMCDSIKNGDTDVT